MNVTFAVSQAEEVIFDLISFADTKFKFQAQFSPPPQNSIHAIDQPFS